MATYHWYCPECGREDYDYPEDEVVPPRCEYCEVDMCKLEPEDEDDE